MGDAEHFINPAYLRAGTWKEAQEAFTGSTPLRHLQATGFFNEGPFTYIRHLFAEADPSHSFTPDMHSIRGVVKERDLLRFADLHAFISSEEFRLTIRLLTGIDMRLTQFLPLRFQRGDYTLLNDATKLAPNIDVFLDFSDDGLTDARGEIVYLTKSEELLRVAPHPNSLVIVPRPAGVMRYLKRVNRKAGKKAVNHIWLEGWR